MKSPQELKSEIEMLKEKLSEAKKELQKKNLATCLGFYTAALENITEASGMFPNDDKELARTCDELEGLLNSAIYKMTRKLKYDA